MRPSTLRVVRSSGTTAPLAGAVAGVTERSGLLVRVDDADGCVGLGEASPLPGYSPDSIEQCERELRAVNLGSLPPVDDADAAAWLDRALQASGLRAPAAVFGLETALLDWLGRRRALGFAEMLGGAAAAWREVPLSALVADLPAARAAFERGVRAFKLKLAPDTFASDLALARRLRDEFGAAATLRFDANRRLDPGRVRAQLAELAGFDPEFVEEPTDTLTRFAPGDAPVTLAADESLAQAGAWPALARHCSVVVLKPTLLGGLGACLRIARQAAERGLAATVTHTFDGPIALAAAAELALALPGRVLACGLDPHRGLAAWPALELPQLRPDRVVSAGGPGLGLALPASS